MDPKKHPHIKAYAHPIRLAVALTMALRLRRGGFSILATVCSSWIFISRSQSGRSQWQPLGNRQHRFVENANVSCPNQTSADFIFICSSSPIIPLAWPPKTNP